MQTKFRNGSQTHEIREENTDRFVTECGRVTYDHFRHKLNAKVTCLQCLEKIEKKERGQSNG